MIAQLRGTLADKRPNQVLVDVGGVGYLVHIPVSTFYALGDLHSNVTLLIHTQVREDAISLYGGDLVRLTRIPGVGRKTAERMVVELRDKLAAMGTPETARQPAATTGAAADVVSALLNLGYEQHAAEQAVERAGANGAPGSFEALLRATLQQLSAPAQKGARAAR